MSVPSAPVWAFVDETGDVGHAPGSSRYLIVAVVLARNPRPLRKVVVKTRKHLRKKLKNIPELKAKRTPQKIVARLLQYVVELDVEIVTVILDKRTTPACSEPEDWYRLVCAEAVWPCFEKYGWLYLVLDRRYTDKERREKLNHSILARTLHLSQGPRAYMVEIEHSDSAQEKGVQVADAVAWSIGQKYEWGNGRLYEIIKDKIIVEKVLGK
jgi:hypothetical protein